MESRSRASTTVFEAATAPPPLSRTLRPPSASDSNMNSSSSVKAVNETLASSEPPLDPADPSANKTIYDFQVLNCFHELYDLAQHKGSVVLICNVASKDKEYTEAGYTMLTKLYHKHRMEGFVVLAFPCNEFGNGEPGNEDEIAENISCVYPRLGEVDFPVMAKVEVNGDHASPLFTYLKSRIRGTLGQTSVKWNFTFFLCDQAGVPYARFAPGSTLAEIETRIDELLHPRPPPAPPVAAEPPTPSPAVMEDAMPAAPATTAATTTTTTDTTAAAENVATVIVEDTPTPDDFSGCATPPPSEVAQLKADEAAAAAAVAADEALASPPPPPAFVSTMRVTDVTSRGSPTMDEETGEEANLAAANGSSSTLFDKTTNTLEGADC